MTNFGNPTYYTDPSSQIVPETRNQIIGTAVIAEPATLSLLGFSLVGIGLARWRKSN